MGGVGKTPKSCHCPTTREPNKSVAYKLGVSELRHSGVLMHSFSLDISFPSQPHPY